jgi:hypothetical protein
MATGRDLTSEQIAYFAGLFDGEGCIAARLEKNYCRGGNTMARAKVTVAMTDPRPLRMLQDAFGGSLKSKPPKESHHKTKWTWWLGSAASRDFLEQLLPYLVVKKDEAILAIELHKRTTGYRQRNLGFRYGRAPLSQEEMSLRAGLVDQIKRLKHQEIH